MPDLERARQGCDVVIGDNGFHAEEARTLSATLGSIATRLDDKPLPQFLQTIARPLFTPTRRPAAVAARPAAAPAAAPTPSAQGLRLIGLIKTEGGETRVLIRSADEPLGTWVLVGGEVAGWKVTAIGDSKVTVESGGRRFDLNLYAPSSESGETQR